MEGRPVTQEAAGSSLVAPANSLLCIAKIPRCLRREGRRPQVRIRRSPSFAPGHIETEKKFGNRERQRKASDNFVDWYGLEVPAVAFRNA